MGKSTTAQMFAERGVPVWDADQAVHSAYGPSGAAVDAIEALVPGSTGPDGVDRTRLKQEIGQKRGLLKQLEAIVHPLVAEDRAKFLESHRSIETDVVLLDIPLLFEAGGAALCDYVVVVTAPAETQRDRVLSRGSMTETQFETILAAQLPDAEKRERADFIIETTTLDSARTAVDDILQILRTNPDA